MNKNSAEESTKGNSNNWCWTINNPTESSLDLLLPNLVKYSVYGKEVGESGTPHLQGYTMFKNRMRFSAVRKIIPGHLSVRVGTHDQAANYCKKDGDYVEIGEPPVSRKELGLKEKARWELARSAAKSGDLSQVPDDIYVKYYRTLKEISKDHMVKPADGDGVCGTWYYGEAGAGKSRLAREDFPGAYDKPANKWWDGYQLEENVLIDDLDKNHGVLAHHLKIWADRYSFIAEVKGGAMNIRPKHIVITSQYEIEEIWEDVATREALRRRFHCVHVHKPLNKEKK